MNWKNKNAWKLNYNNIQIDVGKHRQTDQPNNFLRGWVPCALDPQLWAKTPVDVESGKEYHCFTMFIIIASVEAVAEDLGTQNSQIQHFFASQDAGK